MTQHAADASVSSFFPMREKAARRGALREWRFLFLCVLLFPAPVLAFELSMPLKCTPGVDCFIQKYVDVDASENWQDYHCGYMSSDGHKGTDFRLPDFTWLEKNVPVLASASGKVTALRNDMEDINIGELSPGSVRDKECGNGVVLDHGKGWKTQYCHMKKGSVRMRVGDKAEKGDTLGFVGLSGETEYPHVHLSVYRDKRIVDPFTGRHMDAGCGKKTEDRTLWDAAAKKVLMHSPPATILGLGFTNRIPPVKEARYGKHDLKQTGTHTPALVLWTDIMGIAAGDVIQFKILAPDGTVLHAHANEIARPQAQLFIYTGKTNQNIGVWPEGAYKGEVTIMRNDAPLVTKETLITISAQNP